MEGSWKRWGAGGAAIKAEEVCWLVLPGVHTDVSFWSPGEGGGGVQVEMGPHCEVNSRSGTTPGHAVFSKIWLLNIETFQCFGA